MADREKVIKAYECCKNPFDRKCEKCPYEKDCCHDGIPIFVIKEIVDLLNESRAEIEHLNRFINGFSRYAMPVVRCKDCKHRPKEPNLETYENGFDIEFPEDSKCPCQCSSDRYYSWYPDDNWFCAEGERRTD